MSWAYFDEENNERKKTKINHLELEGKQIEILCQWELSLFLLLKTSWGIILRGNITKIRIFYVQTSTSRGRRCTLDSVSHGSQDSWSRKPTNKDSNVSNYFLKHVVLNFCKYKKKKYSLVCTKKALKKTQNAFLKTQEVRRWYYWLSLPCWVPCIGLLHVFRNKMAARQIANRLFVARLPWTASRGNKTIYLYSFAC